MVGQTFEQAHQAWYEASLRLREGRMSKAFEKRHVHRERLFLRNVWWPILLSFEHLYPQYEVRDAVNGTRCLDFAYLRPPFRICIKLAGHSDSTEKLSCCSIADNDWRQVHLLADLWIMIHFTYREIRDYPEQCQQTLSILFDRLFRERTTYVALTPSEKEIVRIAARAVRPITPSDVIRTLHICDKTARMALKALVDKELLQPAGGGIKRIRSYEPALDPQLLLYMVG